MAITFDCTCCTCGKNWKCFITNGTTIPTICDDCKEKEENTLKANYFTEQSKLTVEERLRKIENVLFNLNETSNLLGGK